VDFDGDRVFLQWLDEAGESVLARWKRFCSRSGESSSTAKSAERFATRNASAQPPHRDLDRLGLELGFAAAEFVAQGAALDLGRYGCITRPALGTGKFRGFDRGHVSPALVHFRPRVGAREAGDRGEIGKSLRLRSAGIKFQLALHSTASPQSARINRNILRRNRSADVHLKSRNALGVRGTPHSWLMPLQRMQMCCTKSTVKMKPLSLTSASRRYG